MGANRDAGLRLLQGKVCFRTLTSGEVIRRVCVQSLNDEREGALWKEEAEKTHQESMRAGRPKGQCHQSPGVINGCPPPILTLQGDWWPLGMARDGTG